MTPHKIALVTGAGTGIGRAVALAFLKKGYAVALTGRRAELLQETASLSLAPSSQILIHAADISQEHDVLSLFEASHKRFGRLDVLFNNAGMGTPIMPFDEIPFASWQAVVGVNLTGAFLCAQQAFKMMRHQSPQGGRIINNGSIAAHSPRPFSAPYTSTKHAITGLTKSIALDGRPYQIACSQIDIGNAATEMTNPMAAGIIQADGSLKAEDRIDLMHVANAVLQMAELPLDTNILEMTIMATNMPYVGRG